MKILKPLVLLGAGLTTVAAEPSLVLAQEPDTNRAEMKLSEAELSALAGELKNTAPKSRLEEALDLSFEHLQDLQTKLDVFARKDPEAFKVFLEENRDLILSFQQSTAILEQKLKPDGSTSGSDIAMALMVSMLIALGIGVQISMDLNHRNLATGEDRSVLRAIGRRGRKIFVEQPREKLKARLSSKLATMLRTEAVDLLKDFKEALRSGQKRRLNSIKRKSLDLILRMNDSEEEWSHPKLKHLLEVLINLDDVDIDMTDCENKDQVESLMHSLIDLGIRPLNASLSQFISSQKTSRASDAEEV